VIPYTTIIDRETGGVETFRGLRGGVIDEPDAPVKAFLVQYVIARESSGSADLPENRRKVLLWSADGARERYVETMEGSEVVSRTTALPVPSVGTIIKGVSLLSPTTASVQFDTTNSRASSADSGWLETHTAVVFFRSTGRPLRSEDRLLNPLGIQVTSYRRDDESAASSQLSTATPGATPPPGASPAGATSTDPYGFVAAP
jgi:type IV secretion system protein VirB8